MPQITIRPNLTVWNGANTVVVAAANIAAALSDNNVGSYVAVEYPTDINNAADLELGDVGAIPDNAIITRVRARALIINVTALDNFDGSFISGVFWSQIHQFFGTAFNSQNQGTDSASGVEVAGPWLTMASPTLIWYKDLINHMRIGIYGTWPNSSDPGQLAHIYELYVDVEYNLPPDVAIITPPDTSIVATDAPKYSWNFTDPEGDPQNTWQVKVFTAAQVAAFGFNPGFSGAYADSGIQSGSAQSWQGPSLPNGVYRWYINATQTPMSGGPAGGVSTGWVDYAGFTVLALPIAPPTLRPVPPPYSSDAAIYLSLMGGMNLSTLDDSSGELTTGSWATGGPTGVARTAVAGEFKTGSAGLKFTSTAAGTCSGITTALTNVVVGQLYRARLAVKPSVARTIFPVVYFVDGAGTVVGSIVDFTGTAVGAGAFTTVLGPIGVAPAGTVSARLGFSWGSAGAGEIMYVDDDGVVPAQVENSVYDPANNSFFENGIGYWSAVVNGNAPVRTVVAGSMRSGAAALQMQATAAGTMKYAPFALGNTVVSVDSFSAQAAEALTWKIRTSIKAAATARNIRLGYMACDKSGAVLGVDDGPVLGADFTSGHFTFERQVVIPAGTTRIYPYVVIEACVAGEVHYLDEFLTWQVVDTATTWGRGGLWPPGTSFPSTLTYEVQASYDGQVTWAALPHVDPYQYSPSVLLVDQNQHGVVTDWAAPPNKTVYYRARAVADVGTGLLKSPWGVSPPLVPLGVGAFLKDPYLSKFIGVTLETFSRRYVEPQTAHYPLGRAAAVVVSEGPKGDILSIGLRTLDATTRAALETMLRSGRPLMFVNTLGEVWWIKVTDGGDAEVVKAGPVLGDVYGIRDFYRYSLTAVQVVAPDLG